LSGREGTQAAAAQPSGNGYLLAGGAYAIWGLLPLYFRLLQHVGPVEIVAQRVVWSLALVLVLVAMRTGLPSLWAVLRNRRVIGALAVSAGLIATNWLVYVWAVHNGHVVAASLGYFLNPLVNILLGVVVLGERLRRGQVIAIAVAAIGVAILAMAAVSTLWISLMLAVSFALYGLVRKLTPVAPMRGLAAETILLAPVALAYLVWLAMHGRLAFGADISTSALLVLAGGVTALPLLLFAMAAQLLPLVRLGILQYIAPILQFMIGVAMLGEALSRAQIVSFALIWAGLILFTVDALRAARQERMLRAATA
jgi:chloramphenicol-sensitive protein RarD